MKKRLLILALLSSMILTACGKEASEDTVEEPHYAVNEVKDQTSNDESSDEESAKKDNSFTEIDGITFIYPTDDDDNFYINGMPIAKIINYDFKLDKVISTDDNYRDLSRQYKIYAQSYDKLNLSDEFYTNSSSFKSLSTLVPATEEIVIGNASFSTSDLFVSINDFNSLIKLFNDKFTSRQPGDSGDIFSYAVSKEPNDIWGDTYTWKFSINDAELEYTHEELASIKQEMAEVDYEEDEESVPIYTDPNSEITVTAVYNAEGVLSSYSVDLNKLTHVWKKEITREISKEVGTGKYKTVAIDPNGNVIPDEDISLYSPEDISYVEEEITDVTTEVEHTGQYINTRGGYDFTNAYILLKDMSKIGLDSFSYTIHNPSLNRSLNIDYTFDSDEN